MTTRSRTLSLASIYFTFFIDNLCWSIVFPIFPPFFLDPGNQLFSSDVSETTKASILGFFLMAFSLGQFIGAPIIGEYGDKHGRRKALMLSIFFTLVGLGLTAWSMQEKNLIFLFLGRLITGIFASSTSVCLACVSDLFEDEKMKMKYFGYFSVAAGLSFILGAFVGGKLSDPTVSPFFSPNFPIWIATWMTLFNLIFLFFGFKETFRTDPSMKFDFLECFHNLQSVLRTKTIKKIYSVYFLFLISWTILFQFIPVVVVQRYSFTGLNIGDLALFMGIWWAIGSSYLNRLLLHFFAALRILEVCLILFTLLSAFVMFPQHIYWMLVFLGSCVMIGGLAWPVCNGVISGLADREIQGKALGISQSIQSLAMTMASLIGALAFKVSFLLPFYIGTGASLLAGVIYFSFRERS